MAADVTALPPGFLIDQDAGALPPGFTVDPGHAVAGPTGNWWLDQARNVGSAALDAGNAIVSPIVNAATSPAWKKTVEAIPSATGAAAPATPEQARDNAYKTVGLTEYEPQTETGRMYRSGLTAALATAATGQPAAAPVAFGGGMTSQLGHDLAPAGYEKYGEMAGFIPGAIAGQAAMNVPQRLGAALTGTGTVSEPYGAFQRQGLPTNLAGTATGEAGPVWAEKFAARMPGSESAIADARGNLVDAWQNRFDQIAGRIGTAGTAQEAGTSLQSAAANWVDQFKNQQAARWGLFDTLVPPSSQIGVSNFRGALNDVLQDFGGANNLAKVLQPQLAANLKGALGADLNGGTTLPWQAVQSVRTALGAMLENPQPIEGMGKSAIKRLYAGLSQDMENGANAAGQQAATAFRQANAVTRTGHDILDNFVNPIIQAETPEKAAQWALAQARLGGTRVAGVAQNLPSAAGDLSSYALRNAAGNGDNPSPTALATALTGRKPAFSPEAAQALFSNPQDAADITDMATAGKAMQPFEKDLANSPTATHAARGVGRLVTALEMSKEGGELAGMPGRIAGFGAGFMAPNIAGRLAQATALNPYLAALYGRNIPVPAPAINAPLMARALMARGVQPQLPQPGVPLAPATSANSSMQ